MARHALAGRLAPTLAIVATILVARGPAAAQTPSAAQTPPAGPAADTAIIRKLTSPSERMEMIINSSRILTLDQKIPVAQVNNPEILQISVLSPNQVQISAKKAGVTQVNLWDEKNQIYTVDVIVHGDARELEDMLTSQFPAASLKVIPIANSIYITGFVDQPEHVNHVIRIAEEYYPKVINNITVSGVQQVLLHVKVMEVSRTKLRALGFDWSQLSNNNIIVSGVSGLISSATAAETQLVKVDDVWVQKVTPPSIAGSGSPTFGFNVTQGTNAFFGVLEALRRDNLLKILAEPTLVTVSGRPATFNVGGEIPILVPQSLGTVSIEYKKYGTQLDFIPIVLGDGKIRLEVRPKISEIDPSNSIVLAGTSVPGLRSREVETGVEMNAGQTLAIAGLVQSRIDSQRRMVPIVGELPYVGALFRRVEERNNEIELLILVTPEIVDPLDPQEVPPCGPGMRTTSPSDHELYWKGHLEVPQCCPPGTPGTEGQPGSSEMAPSPDPASEPLPGMLRGGSEGAPPADASAVRQGPVNPYNPAYPQGASRVARRPDAKPLPGFKGQIGYQVLR
ncbi:MAG: pilus assembly protein N-terminal domain-containing protein [Pirellulales bacterium]|nr:pilus assembly protein N-terminal domain-containing protein [Pirellulales bacterium]